MIAMLRFEVSALQQSSDKGLLCKIPTLLSFRRRDLTLIDLFNTPYFFVFHYPADTASVPLETKPFMEETGPLIPYH